MFLLYSFYAAWVRLLWKERKEKSFILVICIAKYFIWTTLKDIFCIFRFFLHPQIPDFQIVASRPNFVLTNHTSMESLFIQLADYV